MGIHEATGMDREPMEKDYESKLMTADYAAAKLAPNFVGCGSLLDQADALNLLLGAAMRVGSELAQELIIFAEDGDGLAELAHDPDWLPGAISWLEDRGYDALPLAAAYAGTAAGCLSASARASREGIDIFVEAPAGASSVARAIESPSPCDVSLFVLAGFSSEYNLERFGRALDELGMIDAR